MEKDIEDLDDRQTVPLTRSDRDLLKRTASEFDAGPGLLARVLIQHGLKSLGNNPELGRLVAAERELQRQRHSSAGQAAMESRWGANENKGR